VFEIKGTEKPEEIVIVGGHTDSWDCQFAGCQGAHDDGQGVVVALETIRILHEAGLRPKRTIRAVLFVDEEVTQSGAIAYMQAHRHEAENIVAAMETDLGAGPVCGFGFSGSEKGRETLRELLRPLAALGDVANVDDRWEGKGI
jgi:Zn-dependent M28 family amino/carboxypeptidase